MLESASEQSLIQGLMGGGMLGELMQQLQPGSPPRCPGIPMQGLQGMVGSREDAGRGAVGEGGMGAGAGGVSGGKGAAGKGVVTGERPGRGPLTPSKVQAMTRRLQREMYRHYLTP